MSALPFDDATARLDAWVGAHALLVQHGPIELSFVLDARWEAGASYGAHGVRRGPHGLLATVQLAVFDEVGGKRRVQDIKQQELLMAPASALGDLDRLFAFLDAWAAVLPRAVEQRFAARVEVLTPHDLLQTGVLGLKRPRSAADFEAALERRWKLTP